MNEDTQLLLLAILETEDECTPN